jgi:hypothetical protein
MLAALSLVVLLLVVSALAPASRPRRRSGPAARRPAHSVRTPTHPPSPAAVSPSELDEARRTARRFLAGYLRFLYGRGSGRTVEGATRAFLVQPTRTRAVVTPAERRRHPRLVSVGVVAQAPAVVLATAFVSDGGVTSYALRITVRRGPTGWLVSGVDGG